MDTYMYRMHIRKGWLSWRKDSFMDFWQFLNLHVHVRTCILESCYDEIHVATINAVLNEFGSNPCLPNTQEETCIYMYIFFFF